MGKEEKKVSFLPDSITKSRKNEKGEKTEKNLAFDTFRKAGHKKNSSREAI